jgi:hypothetical protein
VLEPSDALDLGAWLVGLALLAVGGYMLVQSLRREYRDLEPERRRKRFNQGGRP